MLSSPEKVIKRNTAPIKGYWALPGEIAEPGETVEKSAFREVKEEAGFDVAIVGKIGECHEESVQKGVEYDYYPACFLVRVLGGKLRKQAGEIQHGWTFQFGQCAKQPGV